MKGVWKIRVDTGGTFTDAWGEDPDGTNSRCKVLSDGCLRLELGEPEEDGWRRLGSHAAEWPDKLLLDWRTRNGKRVEGHKGGKILLRDPAPVVELSSNEEAPVVAARILTRTPLGKGFPPLDLRVATTRGTNALLERKGAKVALFVNRGFEDLLDIRDQRRELLFSLAQPSYDSLAFRVYGITGRLSTQGHEVEEVDESEWKRMAREALKAGCEVAAVSLLNAWRESDHELRLARLLKNEGFADVVCSSEVSPLIRLLPRTDTTVADAFLTLIMQRFISRVAEPFDHTSLSFMTSAGGLVPAARFHPKDSLLSGPAGGLIGAVEIGRAAGFERLLTFDMGGTSSDVARIEGAFSYSEEQQVGAARVMAPALRIETVAAGGGSICAWRNGQLEVGPESAGASPGPACYGRGGPFTLTDVN
ncbi:MAG: hydantoinase/oxoprolinase family protein, partial [Verrucomicrobiales bacterium]